MRCLRKITPRRVSPHSTISVFVTYAQGQLEIVLPSTDSTILDVKKGIEQKVQIVVENQRLLWKDTVQWDRWPAIDKTLSLEQIPAIVPDEVYFLVIKMDRDVV